ncbi:titin homolog isoform X2 [Daphnia carinata]|uniref:titin homolog isoform X2 n=1 Tax=Daphnia carinata TaxID=120202 RepID=UPI002868D8C5|nr:titin homolog isoform X2 [Daphnia carinata]
MAVQEASDLVINVIKKAICPTSVQPVRREEEVLVEAHACVIKSNAVATTDGEDWDTEADVWSSRNSSASNVRATMAASEVNDWSATQRTTIKSANSCDPRLVSSISCPFVWNGTIRHRSMLFRINMENLDTDSSSDLANLAIPTALRVVGTIEPEKVWNYLRQVRTTRYEKIVVFRFTQAVKAEISYADCYEYFLDGVRKRNCYGVVGSVPDSKLPCTIKDFYITPLPKEDHLPKELETIASARCLRENRFSDLLLAIVVIQSKRPMDQTCYGTSGRPSKVAKVENSTIPVDDGQTESGAVEKIDAMPESQSAPAQAPSQLTAIRQKLQQDIQSVDPVKARIHTHALQHSAAKISSSKTQLLGKPLPAVQTTIPLVTGESSDATLEAEKEASPCKVPIDEEKVQIPAPVDGELLMKQAIMEELNRQIDASKQIKFTEVYSTLPSETLNFTPDEPVKPIAAELALSSAPVLPDGPLTRFRSKRQTVAEKVPTIKQTKVTVSSNSDPPKEIVDLRTKIDMLKEQRRARISRKEIDIPKEAKKHPCLIESCRNDAQSDSIYCSDECILSHVQDSRNAMSKEKMNDAQLQEPSDPSTSLTTPNASSDESMFKDSIDYTLLKAQPTPALASKLLAMTEMRKSLASGNKPTNLAKDTSIPIMEKKTGKILCGASAPTVGNLEQWLKSNPTYEIIKPESLPIKPSLPTVSTISSTQTARSTTPQANTHSSTSSSKGEVDSRNSKKPSDSSSSSKAKGSRKRSLETPKAEETSAKVAKPDTESTRVITRSSLKEALWNRCKDVNDLEIDEAAVEEIANEVEESLYTLFKQDVSIKYKSKYRSLIYNIKDPKNSGLFLEIVTKQITPVQLVKMSTEELASKDLAEWREQEAKRQLNLIEKNEQERLSQVNKYLIKTHKGEEFIKEVNEDYGELDDDTSKTAGFPDTPPEDSSLKHILPRFKSDLDSSQTFEKKDAKRTTSSRSSMKDDGFKRSKSTVRSSRHSESKSRGYDYRSSSRQSEKKDRERHDRHSSSSSKSRSKYRHHSRKSNRYKEQAKSPKSHAISPSTELEADGFRGFNEGEELRNYNQLLSLHEEVAITTADSNTLWLERKLMKQLIVLEELNRRSDASEREVIDEHVTFEGSLKKGDSVTSKGAIPSTPTTQPSMSPERCCNISVEGMYQNIDKEKVTAEVNQIDTDSAQYDLKEKSGLAGYVFGMHNKFFR